MTEYTFDPFTLLEPDDAEVQRARFAASVLLRTARARVGRARLELLEAERELSAALERVDLARSNLDERSDDLESTCRLYAETRDL